METDGLNDAGRQYKEYNYQTIFKNVIQGKASVPEWVLTLLLMHATVIVVLATYVGLAWATAITMLIANLSGLYSTKAIRSIQIALTQAEANSQDVYLDNVDTPYYDTAVYDEYCKSSENVTVTPASSPLYTRVSELVGNTIVTTSDFLKLYLEQIRELKMFRWTSGGYIPVQSELTVKRGLPDRLYRLLVVLSTKIICSKTEGKISKTSRVPILNCLLFGKPLDPAQLSIVAQDIADVKRRVLYTHGVAVFPRDMETALKYMYSSMEIGFHDDGVTLKWFEKDLSGVNVC